PAARADRRPPEHSLRPQSRLNVRPRVQETFGRASWLGQETGHNAGDRPQRRLKSPRQYPATNQGPRFSRESRENQYGGLVPGEWQPAADGAGVNRNVPALDFDLPEICRPEVRADLRQVVGELRQKLERLDERR